MYPLAEAHPRQRRADQERREQPGTDQRLEPIRAAPQGIAAQPHLPGEPGRPTRPREPPDPPVPPDPPEPPDPQRLLLRLPTPLRTLLLRPFSGRRTGRTPPHARCKPGRRR